MTDRPILAIPLGDAAGVGPEVVARTLLDDALLSRCRPLVVGKAWVLERAFDTVGERRPVRAIASFAEARLEPGVVDILDFGLLRPDDVRIGQVAHATGRESGETLMAAARLVAAGQADGLVSAPVNKAALASAGFGHGHLELVATAVGCAGPLNSLLAAPSLKVMNMTGHRSVVEACRQVRADVIRSALLFAHATFRQWGYPQPRIAVCALNPHNGDAGTFGREEIEEIAPGVAGAREAGVDARGPFPVDTLFARAIGGEFDLVLSLYHDQGFTPVKTIALHDTASVGMGLPFPYATTDHGTGYDIAGSRRANPGSFKQAMRVVIDFCRGAGLSTGR